MLKLDTIYNPFFNLSSTFSRITHFPYLSTQITFWIRTKVNKVFPWHSRLYVYPGNISILCTHIHRRMTHKICHDQFWRITDQIQNLRNSRDEKLILPSSLYSCLTFDAQLFCLWVSFIYNRFRLRHQKSVIWCIFDDGSLSQSFQFLRLKYV